MILKETQTIERRSVIIFLYMYNPINSIKIGDWVCWENIWTSKIPVLQEVHGLADLHPRYHFLIPAS